MTCAVTRKVEMTYLLVDRTRLEHRRDRVERNAKIEIGKVKVFAKVRVTK